MNESQALDALAAMAESTRLRILRFLVTRGAQGASAGEIAKAVDASSSRNSFHLSNLTQSGLISSEKQSRKVIYRVEFDALGGLIAYLLEECCAGHPKVLACCTPKQQSS